MRTDRRGAITLVGRDRSLGPQEEEPGPKAVAPHAVDALTPANSL